MGMAPAEMVKTLVEAGVHFGHRCSHWNPKMAPYIRGKRNTIHVIDVRETIKGILRAKKLIAQLVSQGKDVLFVGTKRQARHAIEDETRRCGMHFVNERWLGGTLTNFRTIRLRLNRLEELEGLFETGKIDTYSKKMKSTLSREMKKIKTNLDGIRKMERMPGLMFIVDTHREHIAVSEARKMGVTTVALIDTDSNPDLIDLPIPGNDDAMRAIEIVLHEIADTIIEAKASRPDKGDETAAHAGHKHSARAQFSAEAPAAPLPAVENPAIETPAAVAAPAPTTEAGSAPQA